MIMRRFYFAVAFLSLTLPAISQVRYLEEVFDGVTYTPNQVYGLNATILYFPLFEEAVPEPLTFDLYEPAGDTAQLRPLIIYFHTGNFLPYPNNTSVNGTKRDSTVVEMARRMSRMGYVVASADYRLGWNPVAATKDERVLTLINAAYRGVQDANTAIRFFKKTVVEFGNPHRIDTSKIVLFGDGTGGYISLNTGALDAYIKIPTASNGKFLLSDGQGNLFPMVLEGVNGDIEAKQWGINPGIPFLPFPVGDTLNYPNHVEYSSDFAVSVNLGGAIGDTAWIDPGQPPVISIHTPYDPFAPYVEGLVLVPVDPPLEVVEVQGSYLVSYLANLYGNNASLTPHNETSLQYEVTAVANSRNDGLEGLFPIYGTGGPFDSAPWTFWDPATNINSASGFQTNPDMTREKAETYMDSILAYVAPRLFSSLELTVGTENLLNPDEVNMVMYPNPVSYEVFVSANKEYLIRSIDVYDVKGSLVSRREGINHHFTYYKVADLAPGQYVMKVSFDEGVTARQFVVK
jgi:hypothetical protein